MKHMQRVAYRPDHFLPTNFEGDTLFSSEGTGDQLQVKLPEQVLCDLYANSAILDLLTNT